MIKTCNDMRYSNLRLLEEWINFKCPQCGKEICINRLNLERPEIGVWQERPVILGCDCGIEIEIPIRLVRSELIVELDLNNVTLNGLKGKLKK